jgi:hypothetical protein
VSQRIGVEIHMEPLNDVPPLLFQFLTFIEFQDFMPILYLPSVSAASILLSHPQTRLHSCALAVKTYTCLCYTLFTLCLNYMKEG